MHGAQMSLDDALAARDAGVERVTDRSPNFVDLMRDEARAICMRKGEVTSDDLRLYASRINVEPHHPNAWGAVFRSKDFTLKGHRKSALVSNHGREIKVWGLVDHVA